MKKLKAETLLLCFGLAWSAAVTAAEVAVGELYTVRDLAWDGAGTNWQVLVRTQTNASPIQTFTVPIRRTPVSNLVGGTTYYLAVRAQSNGIWSAESTNFSWPQPRENYQTWWQEARSSPTATAIVVPGTLSTVTNPPIVPHNFRTLRVAMSNNIAPYQFPQ